MLKRAVLLKGLYLTAERDITWGTEEKEMGAEKIGGGKGRVHPENSDTELRSRGLLLWGGGGRPTPGKRNKIEKGRGRPAEERGGEKNLRNFSPLKSLNPKESKTRSNNTN